MSFLTVFQSYQDDKGVIIKGCVEGSLVYARKNFCYQGPRSQNRYISRPVLNFGSTGTPGTAKKVLYFR